MNSTSAANSIQKLKLETTGPIAISTKRLGDLAEQWVAMLAAWKGASFS